MSGQIDPNDIEEWFALVSRWEQVESDLRTLSACESSPDPVARNKQILAEAELVEIKRKMDSLISRAKLSKSFDKESFLVGNLELKRD